MEGEETKKGGDEKEPVLEGRVQGENTEKVVQNEAVHDTRPKEKKKLSVSASVRKIERLTAKERDILKESVARRARIEKLETIQRSIRNKKQYERRQALVDADKAEARRNRDKEDEEDFLDEMHETHVNNTAKYFKYFVGGAGLLAAGFFLSKK